MTEEMKKAVLCYVESPWAYFTTQDLSKQWGEDWDDVSYEYNAGTPYEWYEGRDGEESWKIFKVAWDGNFQTPSQSYGGINSPWSVEDINSGVVAWLHTSRWISGPKTVIPAGTTLEKFCELIQNSGEGTVYVPLDKKE